MKTIQGKKRLSRGTAIIKEPSITSKSVYILEPISNVSMALWATPILGVGLRVRSNGKSARSFMYTIVIP